MSGKADGKKNSSQMSLRYVSTRLDANDTGLCRGHPIHATYSRAEAYQNCNLCPRLCRADRRVSSGFCGETQELRLAFAGIHMGEEPPLTGSGGSGAIFVSGCNLGCAFCQNYQISKRSRISEKSQNFAPLGRIVGAEEFSGICLALQKKGACNINIVTGSHAAPAIAIGIDEARRRGLTVPVLWNSSGYEGEETLEILKGFVDVYLPDLKTLDAKVSGGFFNAPDYPNHAASAILKMIELKSLAFNRGMMTSGVMVRHLVIPGFLEATQRVLSWFAENCRGKALLSLMTQYTPVEANGDYSVHRKAGIPERFVSESEYEAVLSMLDKFKIDDGFCQELTGGNEWLPDFRRANPFSSELSIPVWHWQYGYAV